MIGNIILTFATFYGGLIALGFVTKWYIPLILFVILFGHASHLDYLFLRRKDLRRELGVLLLEDMLNSEMMMADLDEDLASMEEQNLH